MILWIIVLGGGKRRESDASIGAADGGVVGFALLGQNKTNAQTSCIFLVIVSRKQRTKSKIKNKDQAKAFEVSIDVVPECVCILLNGPPIELCIQFYTTKSIHQIPSCQRLSIKAYRKEIKQIKKVLHKQCLHILESDLKYGSPIHIAVTPAHSNRCYYLTKA